jgi:type IV pilus assembly protein PilW
MRRAPPSSGFTLVELMTSVVIMVLVLGAVAATFSAVQRTYQLQAQVKSSVEGARTTDAFLSRVVRMAGYGIDPVYAFDFQTGGLPPGGKDNSLGAGFVTDDLAFRYRDPAWLRRGSLNPGGTALTLDGAATFGVAIRLGQKLVITCKGARQAFIAVATAAAAAGTNTVGVSASGTPPFNAGPLSVASPCMKSVTGPNAAYVMLLHEERIRIVALGAPNPRTYLVEFHNLNAPDPLVNTDFDPIAADVENFQVAYRMNRPIPNGLFTATPPVDQTSTGPQNPNWVLGDSGSSATEVIPDPTVVPAPSYDMGYDIAARYTKHPANIRAVRLTAVMRSTRPLAGRQATGVRQFDVENWLAPSPAPIDGYYRTPSITTVRVPNMASRSAFNPLNQELPTDDPNLNLGGS